MIDNKTVWTPISRRHSVSPSRMRRPEVHTTIPAFQDWLKAACWGYDHAVGHCSLLVWYAGRKTLFRYHR